MTKQRRDKTPAQGANPSGDKSPRTVVDSTSYDDRKASWRVSKVQLVDPYGWHEMKPEDVSYVRGKLAVLEKNTWKELFVRDAKWNHRIATSDLKCQKARQWMKTNMPDQPYLWTLRLTNTERIWGIMSEGAYLLVFWDPSHLIWEIPRR